MYHTAYYTLAAASEAQKKGLPWTVRLEYVGYNSKNASRKSYKFWEASGTPGSSVVKIVYGRIGTQGNRPLKKDWSYVVEKTPEKIKDGYAYDSRCKDTVPPMTLQFGTISDSNGILEVPVPANRADLLGPGPYSRIRKVRRNDAGKYEALDESGSLLMVLPLATVEYLSEQVGGQ